MNKEFQLNINITKEEDIENEDEEEEEDEEDSDDRKEIIKPSFMKKIDFENYKEIKTLVCKNREFNSFLSPKEYCKLKKLFIQNKKNLRKEKEDGSLEKIISDKMKKVINDYFAIEIYSSMQTKIISDFKIDPIKNNKKKIQKKLEDMMKNSKGIANPAQAIKDFKKYIDKIYSYDSSNQTICETISDYESIKQYLEKTSAIRFLLVGPHNSGKSSLLNNFIGYNQNFLPTKTQECTKIGVIIKYIKKGQNSKMYETYFRTNKNGHNYFEYSENNLVAEGEKAIYKKIDELNQDENAKNELRFVILQAPIEFLDQMDITEEQKQKIEIIDFPGLDTNFKEAKKKAENLLKIIDGFIYVNFQIHFDDGDTEILRLMYNTIKSRSNFSFQTCLFILNKIDIIEQDSKEINYEEISKKILKIFDNENVNMSSIKVLEQKERIGDKELSLTPFSCLLYKEYKQLEANILNFEKFIRINSLKDKDKNSYEDLMNPLTKYQDPKIIKTIIKNLEENYFKKINLKKFNIQNDIFEDYLQKLKNLITFKNPNENDLKKIVKLYLYILGNRKKLKEYQLSHIESLLKNYKVVILKTIDFFKIKQRNDALVFISNSFKSINELFHITKLKMNDNNIDNFKRIDKYKTLNEINREMENVKDDIESEFQSSQRIINDKINRCNNESDFKSMNNDNYSILNELTEKVKRKSNRFDNFLKSKNQEIIDQLNLQELQKDKQKFEDNMRKLEGLNISNSISQDSKNYIETYDKVYITGFWWWEKKETKKLYDHSKTKSNYQQKINKFFEENKEKSLKIIEENKNKIYDNIEGIFNKFNEEVTGFKNHINEFETTVKDVESFIYEVTGIK